MFQDMANYPTMGAYAGLGNPFYSQHAALQGALNPFAAGQTTGQGYAGGIPGYGAIHPQHLQLAAMIAAQQSLPQLAALAQLTGLTQNPILSGILQNPLAAHLYSQQLQAATGGHQLSPYGQAGNPWAQQAGNPYAQQGNPWAQQTLPLAPQTWVGPGGQIGQQIHPLLAQLVARQLAGAGIAGFGLGY